jgi:hypothetical protein
MRSFVRNLLASTSLLAIAACGPSRLSDSDVTRLCTLQVRCGVGSQEACEASTSTNRDAANATGCGGQFGALGRCLIREDECTLPAACADEQERLETCLSRPRDTGPRVDSGFVFPDTGGGTCTPQTFEEGSVTCSDFCDNDEDGTSDCNDESCCGSVECPLGTVCGGGSCEPASVESGTYCTDGCDNDGDAVFDCNDTSCCESLLGECPAGTVCGAPATPSELRMTSGFLEVYYMGEWRSVCDDGFDQQDADVACRQMGYSGAESFMTSVSGTNEMFWLDDLACTGEESTLDDCASSGWGVENCGATESVSVVCY